VIDDDYTRQYSTVGIEDQTETVAMLYCYSNQYAPGAAPLSSGLAVKFTTAPPVYRPLPVNPGFAGPLVRVLGSSVSSGDMRIALDTGGKGVRDLAVFDATGRRVRSLSFSLVGLSRQGTILWDGRDDGGRRVPSGLYWVRLRTGDEAPAARFLVVH